MAENENEQITPEELQGIKAQLAEEQQAKAALEEAAAGKDSRIAELETALSEAKQSSEATAAELAAASEAKNQAVAKYLTMARALNPNIPESIIGGESIAEIDQSVDKGKAIVEAVKKAMESEASAAKVPAGAPPRGGIPTEGMSPKEKIAYAIQPK